MVESPDCQADLLDWLGRTMGLIVARGCGERHRKLRMGSRLEPACRNGMAKFPWGPSVPSASAGRNLSRFDYQPPMEPRRRKYT